MKNAIFILDRKGVGEILKSSGVANDMLRRGKNIYNMLPKDTGETNTPKIAEGRTRKVCVLFSHHRNRLKALYREAGR